MTKDAEGTFAAALALTSKDRAHLSAVLADSIEHGDPDAIQAAWAKEIDRRLAAYRSGDVETYAVEDVEREAEALIADLNASNVGFVSGGTPSAGPRFSPSAGESSFASTLTRWSTPSSPTTSS